MSQWSGERSNAVKVQQRREQLAARARNEKVLRSIQKKSDQEQKSS